MTREKMLAARQLIEEKNYMAARSILKTVDHPKAREWERRLDGIDASHTVFQSPARAAESASYPVPPRPNVQYVPVPVTPKQKSSGVRTPLIILFLLLAGFAIGIHLWASDMREREIKSYEIDARVSLSLFCTMSTYVGDLTCEQWTHEVIRDYRDKIPSIALCGEQYDFSIDSARLFADCLIWNDIPLPF